jgi:hypothetical protein
VTAALAASFLFLAGLAAGAVAVSATIRLAHGRWAGPLLPAAERGAVFLGPAAVLLAAVTLTLGPLRGLSAPAVAWLAARQLAAGLLVLGLGWRYVARTRAAGAGAGAGSVRGAAAAAVAGFAAGVSLWAAAVALEPAPWPPFAAVPAAEVLGAFVSGLAFTVWAGAPAGGADPGARRDLATLLFGFLLLWAYLGGSIFLPIWYGDVPEEVAFLLARWSGVFRPAAAAAVIAWALAALLVFPRAAIGRSTLVAAATLALAARLLQVLLLVLPALAPGAGAGALAVAGGAPAAAAVLLLVAVRRRAARARRAPAPPSAAALAGPDDPRSESPSLGG